jgi:rare lipoprotein A (peptidoglycan hydrolase)
MRLLITGVLLLLVTAAHSMQAQDARVDALRTQAATLQRQADSVKRVWGIQWRRSDSLRIESMFLRMRSDSLRREEAAREEAAQQDSIERAASDTTVQEQGVIDSAVVLALAQRHRKGDVKLGQTLSDSATADVMRTDRDTGTASYYAEAFHGKKTSNGEKYDMHDRTCAHRWLPYNTHVRVTNLANGRSVVVRVNDRGPWKHTRLIDLSKGAAKELDMIRSGTARVAIEVVDP